MHIKQEIKGFPFFVVCLVIWFFSQIFLANFQMGNKILFWYFVAKTYFKHFILRWNPWNLLRPNKGKTLKLQFLKKSSLKHFNFYEFWLKIWYKDWVKVICHALFSIWTTPQNHCEKYGFSGYGTRKFFKEI